MNNWSNSFATSDQLGEMLRITAYEVVVTEGADTGLRLGPFAETKVVELTLETRKLAVVKVLGQDCTFESLGVRDLKGRAVVSPCQDRLIFVLKDVIEATKEFGYTRARPTGLWLNHAFVVFGKPKLLHAQLMMYHDDVGHK